MLIHLMVNAVNYLSIDASLSVIFSTLYLASDFQVSLYHCIVLSTCYIVDQIDNNFWKSLLLLPIITMLYSGYEAGPFYVSDIFQFIIFSCLTFIVILTESNYFPEEASDNKIISRLLLIIILMPIYYLWPNSFIRKIFTFGIGYCLVSIVSQTESLYPKNM
jgi:hypothetical protein